MERHGGYRHYASEKTGVPLDQWLDFSANINPFGMPESVQKAMEQALKEVVHYPDPECRELTKAVAQKEGVEQERILCGNGGADVLYRYIRAVKPKKTLLPIPTFVEYEDILRNIYCDEDESTGSICYYKMDENFLIKEDFLIQLEQGYDLVILCTPNNPTGKCVEEELLYRIVDKTEEMGTQLLMDYSFQDFLVEKREKQYAELKKREHVSIIQSFTKMYGVAGLRLGYAVLGNNNLKKQMLRQGSSWSVNHLAQKAGLAALKEIDFVEKTVQYVEKERNYLIKELRSLGFQVIEGEANYLLIKVDLKKIEDLQEKLQEKRILIRDCSNYKNLSKGYYRIAIKLHQENQQLLKCLKEVIQ